MNRVQYLPTHFARIFLRIGPSFHYFVKQLSPGDPASETRLEYATHSSITKYIAFLVSKSSLREMMCLCLTLRSISISVWIISVLSWTDFLSIIFTAKGS